MAQSVPLPAFAQVFNPGAIFNASFLKSKKTFNFKFNFPQTIKHRLPNQTITSWAYSLKKNNANGEFLLSVLSDRKYMMSNNVYTAESCKEDYKGRLKCEISVLTGVLPHVKLDYNSQDRIINFLVTQLKHPYNIKAQDSTLYYRYSLVAAALVSNDRAGRQMLDELLNIVSNQSEIPSHQVWSARALSEVAYLSPAERITLIRTLERTVLNLSNRLKNEYVENSYLGFKVTNQFTAVKCFMYTLSFFAKKKGDGILKSMITTGTFVKRSAYLQNLLPGVDFKGNFLQTPSGCRHNVAFNLIVALFNAYAGEGRYEEMNDFIINYAQLNWKRNDFQNYLLFAMYGMELAAAYNENESIEGWQEQYDNFAYAIGKAIWKADPVTTVCVTAQGGAEVCAEWVALTELLKTVGAGVKAGTSFVFKFLPAKQLFRISLITAGRRTLWRSAGKWIVGEVPAHAQRQIKVVVVSCLGLAITGDSPTRPMRGTNITMPRQEVLKKIMH